MRNSYATLHHRLFLFLCILILCWIIILIILNVIISNILTYSSSLAAAALSLSFRVCPFKLDFNLICGSRERESERENENCPLFRPGPICPPLSPPPAQLHSSLINGLINLSCIFLHMYCLIILPLSKTHQPTLAFVCLLINIILNRINHTFVFSAALLWRRWCHHCLFVSVWFL